MLGIDKTLPLALAFFGACTLYAGGDGSGSTASGSHQDFAADAGPIGPPLDAGPVTDDAWTYPADAGPISDDAGFLPDAGPANTCWQIDSETVCILTPNCSPMYEGSGCSCNANGCACTDLTYEYCQ